VSEDFLVSPELLGIYIEDARLHLEALDHGLLSLERDGLDPDTVSAVLGPLHTLKGNSGMLGFASIKDYVHRLEDVLAGIADGSLPLEATLFDRLFAGASALREAVEAAGRGQGELQDLARERQVLDALLHPIAERPSAPPAPVSVKAQADPQEARRPADAQYMAARSNMVRVDFGQLDHLLNLVGELIIYRTKLQEMGRRLATSVADRSAGRELLEAVHQLASVSTQLQETVMDVRMLPIRHVFERFPRLVRDLARQQGKEIELILEGEGTRVDKAIIDEIGEPLVHMIRNSVDHGIETPSVRAARGKTPTGTILLSATQESNQVLITIMDDGGGIDAAEVARKAARRGLIKGDESMTDREAIQLIFSQGFSTAEAVTEVSGRGVGLSVVLKSIERLNGLVEVETVPGVGSKFIIQLPLTLAIIAALLVRVSGRSYAIPLSTVVESLKFGAGDVRTIAGRDTLTIRDQVVPLLSLATLFGLPETEAAPRRYAVILGRGEKRVGIVVDALLGQQEVVIKALDPGMAGMSGAVAGATIMGDGRVVLILDVAALFDSRRSARAAPRGALHAETGA
jgi:two-component system chemotaxis sensor kinase CheA